MERSGLPHICKTSSITVHTTHVAHSSFDGINLYKGNNEFV